MISLDTETTGLDVYHGAMPFAVTTCNEAGENTYWEWHVDPLTRKPQIPVGDIQEIKRLLKVAGGWTGFAEDVAERHVIVGQNIKFDCGALAAIGITDFPWQAVRDTIIAGHLLESNRPHNLTAMARRYLNLDIEPFEKKLEDAVKKCRSMVQQARLREKRLQKHFDDKAERDAKGYHPNELAGWAIAEEGRPDMPSAGTTTWRFDYWLPRAMAKHTSIPETGHEYSHWWTVCRDYFNADSFATVKLWPAMKAEIERRHLMPIYRESLKQLPILYRMEARGITANSKRLAKSECEFQDICDGLRQTMVRLARGRRYDLELPRSGTNNSLMRFMFGPNPLTGQPVRKYDGPPIPGCLNLPWLLCSEKTGEPSLSKEALTRYQETLPAGSLALKFVNALIDSRGVGTALVYMESYTRFWLPVSEWGGGEWFRLHPSINPTGTATLRKSSERINEQNVSKKKKYNLRRIFGPLPGREWWSLDYENLELRIPAYESGEQSLIDLFERADEPPYYGSEHILNFSVVYPDLWQEAIEKAGGIDKAAEWIRVEWKDTWYQWCKNGDFAVGYGSIDRPDGQGTADRTFRRAGSQARLKSRFAKKDALNRKWINYAERFGYVETMPDKTVDPNRGYPLLCTRTEQGRILETVPLNYHVQGTACWCKNKALVRCQEQLDNWRTDDGFDAYVIMDVHDEIGFDFPLGGADNLWRVKELQGLMELSGEDIGVPLRVAYAYHPNNWADKVPVDCPVPA